MKKIKIFIAILIGFVLGALAAVGVYFLTVGEVSWKEYLETKLIPNIVLVITAIGTLATASLPIIARIQISIDKFNKATQDVTSTAESGRKTEGALKEQNIRISEQFDTIDERLSMIEKNSLKTQEMCRIGFCNMGELVKNGYASEIAKVEADDEKETEL